MTGLPTRLCRLLLHVVGRTDESWFLFYQRLLRLLVEDLCIANAMYKLGAMGSSVGKLVSSASAPRLHARVLQTARVGPGMTVWFRSLSRTISFVPEEGHLRSDRLIVFDFVTMQRGHDHAPRVVRLAGHDVRLVVGKGQPADAGALTEACTGPRHKQRVDLWPGSIEARRLKVRLGGIEQHIQQRLGWDALAAQIQVHQLARHCQYLLARHTAKARR
ncbi:hypothetical protein [Streptomyces sp. NPDC093097]|uniref:hypothetical protein n=1 Tax=Streptomyces sp. NPDC093097 TaxID=3366027 RepID=UPI00382A759F